MDSTPAAPVTPVKSKPPKPKEVDREVLEKLHAESKERVARRSKAQSGGIRTTPKQKALIYKEPPRGQLRGPIVAGPSQWVVCTACTKLFSKPGKPVRYGVRKRHVVKHLADHRHGRIRRPESTPAADHRDFHRAEKKQARKAAKAAAK